MDKNIKITLSNDIFDRQEDVYSFVEFGKFVNRFSITEQIISSKFWDYLRKEYKITNRNVTVHCDIQRDIKGREERSYKYIITLERPFKLLLIFYDEQKVIDSELYETEEEQENKIFELIIYHQSDALSFVNDILLKDIDKMTYRPPKDKTFFVISRGTYGYELRNANVKDFDINLKMNYGSSFVKNDKEIIDKLKNNKRGLFLFHGSPGTGKCVVGDTKVKIRNKITGEVEELSIDDFKERFDK